MKYIGFIFLVVFINSSVNAKKNVSIDCMFAKTVNEMRSNRIIKIKPKISCNEVTYCTVDYLKYNLRLEKWNGDPHTNRQLFINNNKIKILSYENVEEEIEMDKSTFPEYDLSTYIFDKKNQFIKIMSGLPSCTGISCKYQIIQLIDLNKRICYEKIIKYYK